MSRLLEQNFLSSQLQKIRLSASYEPLAPLQLNRHKASTAHEPVEL